VGPLGAIGLILPGLLRIDRAWHRWPPPASWSSWSVRRSSRSRAVAPALIPLVVGLLSAFVAYGRRA